MVSLRCWTPIDQLIHGGKTFLVVSAGRAACCDGTISCCGCCLCERTFGCCFQPCTLQCHVKMERFLWEFTSLKVHFYATADTFEMIRRNVPFTVWFCSSLTLHSFVPLFQWFRQLPAWATMAQQNVFCCIR